VGVTQWIRANVPGSGLGALLVSLAPLVALWWFVSALLPHDPDALGLHRLLRGTGPVTTKRCRSKDYGLSTCDQGNPVVMTP